jgi:exodeoxyribonuclease V beta subunit
MRTEIIHPEKNIALKASAGSGKTFALSLRVVNLLLSGVDPGRILCITFTNKATNEMFRRIISLVKYLAFELSPANVRDEALYLLTVLKEENKDEQLQGDFTEKGINDLRQRAGDIYDNVIRNISNLRISTIDSLLNSVLRLFPFEAGVMPDFQMLTETKQRKLTLEAYEEFIHSLESDDKLRDAVGEVIVKSGKAINSPGTFFDPYFERLNDMRIGVERLITEIVTCNEKGEGDACLDDIHREINNVGDMDISIRVEAKALAKRLRESCPEISKPGLGQIKKLEESDASDIASLTSMAKDGYKDYQYFKKCEDNAQAEVLFKKIKRDLSIYLQTRNAVYRRAILYLFSLFSEFLDDSRKKGRSLSFSDVTNTCYRLLVDNGMIDQDSEYFYFRLDSRIDHLLIDEFQDTNFIQWLILKPFVDELTAGLGQREEQGSFFYVGDPKQSIYRFRGGESRLFDTVLEQYSGKISELSLSRNYRSSRSIVEFVNRVFRSISGSHAFEYEEQEAMKDVKGFVDVSFIGPEEFKENKVIKMEKTLGSILKVREKGYREEDITVLCNTNKQCQEYAEFLMLNNIRAVTEGSFTILHSEGVDTIVELLRYLADPRQQVYLLNYLFAVPGLLGEKDRTALLLRGKKNAVPKHINERITRIRSRAGLLPISHIIRMIIDEFDLYSRFERDPNIILLIDMASSGDMEENLSISRFISFINEELTDIKASRTEAVHAVKVLTIHKAKGLEFPVVIVPELEISMSVSARETPLIFTCNEDLSVKNVFLTEKKELLRFNPDLQQAVDDENALAVRDRLNQLYVAFTRAQECLFVTAVVKSDDKKKKNNETPKVSDILYQALEGKDYRQGEIPLKPSQPDTVQKDTGSMQKMDIVIDFVASKKKETDTFDTTEEELVSLSFDNFRARRFGVAFHYAMESLRSFDKDAVNDSIVGVKQLFGSEMTESDIGLIEKRMLVLLNNDHFLKLVDGDRIEKEITYFGDGKIWVADLVVIGKDKVNVIDFKTGHEPDLISKYEKQVGRYCKLATEIYKLPSEGYLCYVLDDRIEISKII